MTIQEQYLEKAKELANELKKEFGDEILGITISGSLTYGNADDFSDIDLDLWLTEEVYKKWVVGCPLMDFFSKYGIKRETPTNFSFGVGETHKFDLALLSVERVKQEEWKVEQKADRKKSIILFDKNDIVKNLLNEKIKIKKDPFDTKEKYSVLNPNPEYYIFYFSAYLNYHVPVAIARKKYDSAHFLINQAINFLFNLLWLDNEDFYPYDKSKLVLFEKHLTKEQYNLLKEAFLLKDFTEEDINRRRKILRELFSKLGYKEVTFYHEKLDLS